MSVVEVPTIDDLQGEWKIVSFGQNGGKAPFFFPWIFKPRLVVKGERYRKYMKREIFEKGKLIIKPASEYSLIDEVITSGDEAGTKHLGIIRWVGNNLEHLQGKLGDKRPLGFPYTKDSMVGYAMMKRRRSTT